jgi:cytochrome P450
VNYLPFGLGPRLCIGREVALIEGVLVLACLLHGRRVVPSTPGPTEIGVNAMITMRPRGGMPLRIVER